MSLRVSKTALYVHDLQARMPFRYGIASMTALPHLFLQLEVNIDNQRHFGIAADSLPPKWFTKNPETSYREDLQDMLEVIRSACNFAQRAQAAETIFRLWQQVYEAQSRWAPAKGYPPLLWGFGVSLVERALIDAFCRATGTTFADAVREGTLGIELGKIYPELAGFQPVDFLPETPLANLTVRHTVGLGDPLTEREILQPLDDGLPQSLEASIHTYGLTHFKIKLCGDVDKDLARLRDVAAVVSQPDYAFTLDGNEQHKAVGTFQRFWQSLTNDAALSPIMNRLLFVEQPFHRDLTFSAETKQALNDWHDRPPIIIDESDDLANRLALALECGYQGTSHKNCKGVFKSIAGACLLAYRRQVDPRETYILSGEDLTNIGPVALLQDLAVLATLGINHAERNGHHYFRGLSMFPKEVQKDVLEYHGDLYRQHEQNFATLDIDHGVIDIASTIAAPFGLGYDLDLSQFAPVEETMEGI